MDLAHALTNCMVTTTSLRHPAVSEINGKVDYSGGYAIYNKGDLGLVHGDHSGPVENASASITLPVIHVLGFQADALYSRISSENFCGGAGHFFWRDPGIGLLGLTGGYLRRDGADEVNTFQAGAEGQLYYKNFTFGAFAGVGSIDYQYSTPFINTDPTRFIGRLSVDYYPFENLRVGASFTTAYYEYMGKVEVEYQTLINGLAITCEGNIGEYSYFEGLIGLRYYFGGNKTLRERQRQDDPPGLTSQILQSFGLYGAKFYDQQNNWLKDFGLPYNGPNTMEMELPAISLAPFQTVAVAGVVEEESLLQFCKP